MGLSVLVGAVVLGLVVLGRAPAVAGVPEVPLLKVESVFASTAVFAGELSPKGVEPSAGSYEFHFRASTAGECEGAGESVVPLPAGLALGGPEELLGLEAVSGLAPSTEYAVCLSETNLEGETARSAVVVFVTLAASAPEAPQALEVAERKATSVTLNGVLNPGAAGEPGRYRFLYAQSGSECTGGGETAEESAGGEPLEFVSAHVEGLTPGQPYTFCVQATDALGESTLSPIMSVSHFTSAVAPEVPLVEAAGEVTSSSAVLHGVLNPDAAGEAGRYRFLYAQSASECTGGGETPEQASSGVSPEAVSASVSGLSAGAPYSVCVRAENDAGEVSLSAPRQLILAPTVEALASSEETAVSAQVAASVNPDGAATGCLVEYGTSTGYGQSVACGPASLPAGTAAVTVRALLSGLSDSEYHWRIDATSPAGATYSPDQTFDYLSAAPNDTPPGSCADEGAREQRGSQRLPDCRAYQLVTPAEKNGALIAHPAFGPGVPEVADDGQRVITRSIQCFAGPSSCVANRGKDEGTPYEFEHTPSGWVTRPLAPPAGDFETYSSLSVDANTGTALFSAPVATGIAAGNPGAQEVFYGRMQDGELVKIGPLGEKGPAHTSYSGLALVLPALATPDLSHILYQATESGETWWKFDHTARSPEERSLYEYVGSDQAHPLLVGVRGAFESETLVSDCSTTYEDEAKNGSIPGLVNLLSRSGRTVFFTAEGHSVGSNCPEGVSAPAAEQVWERVDGEVPGGAHSVLVSSPAADTSGLPGEGCSSAECVEHASAANEATFARSAEFDGASADGGVALFESEQQLTNNAAQSPSNQAGDSNLYESLCSEPCGTPGEEPQAKERRLIDVSETAGHEAVPGGPRLLGIEGFSGDGSHVYFVAEGVLTGSDRVAGRSPEVQAPVGGANNLYVYERDASDPDGSTRFIATLPTSDSGLWEADEEAGTANVTPDGRFLVFLSHRALTADDTRAEGPLQVYEYDAQSQSLVRVSIGEDGYEDDGNAGNGNATIAAAGTGLSFMSVPVRMDPTMSDDGAYVFFRSPDALTPGALNDVAVEGGEAQNFYEYHEGQVYLISDGKDVSGDDESTAEVRFLERQSGQGSTSNLYGTDASGANVFFSTFDSLVPEDTDTQLDFYDAQVCSESEPCSAPSIEPQLCREGACQGPGTFSGAVASAGSATLSGPGNLAPATGVPAPSSSGKPKSAAQVRAEKLKKALKVCRRDRSKKKRRSCEAAARRKYAAKAQKAARKESR